MDHDLSLAPFVPITAADRAPHIRAHAEKNLPGLPYEHRVAIACYAEEHPDWDAYRIHDVLAVEQDIDVSAGLVDLFLETLR